MDTPCALSTSARSSGGSASKNASSMPAACTAAYGINIGHTGVLAGLTGAFCHGAICCNALPSTQLDCTVKPAMPSARTTAVCVHLMHTALFE